MIVIDTHALIWFLQKDVRMGTAARETIELAGSETGVLLPAICAWEIGLIERRGAVTFPGGSLAWLQDALSMSGLTLAPLEPAIAIESIKLDWAHKDPADRMIVATSRYLKAPLMTADHEILDHAKAGHLQAIDARR